jgi:WhiB family redox-sensing transcriptional regulator
MTALAWQDRALCAEVDPDLFFPGKGGGVRAAKRICFRCEVRAECLACALAHPGLSGIWGGTSEQQRLARTRQHRRAA